ncbi:hypothetical protein NEOLEDRAFT_1058217 [Neolentinus lepideus HHB14362 ss-1]|uniref:Protein N-terminal glutamine amidohydrolase n=1 Tax=Neolentinus lepideus HHB14362 ss-1 TaxID=1314782 RepID=A0A165UQ27_9AGAM|nr:hypothetical protein NEOLEDRAFT_1058217 [Neolentinus lepideus HHB14362 ss-1]
MSHPVLGSFDPFAVHPFTSNRGLAPQPPQPTGFPAPIPTAMLVPSAAAPVSPSSTPSSTPPSSQNPLHAPRPRRAYSPASSNTSSRQQQPIFVPFRPEQSSPDLPDILIKKKPAHGFGFGSEPSTPPIMKNSDASAYTHCYCEENIYLLATAFAERSDVKDSWEISVVFISNAGKTVALWNQSARQGVVVWDYHVILVLRPWAWLAKEESADRTENNATTASWVYDFDTQLLKPCTAQEYIAGTFPFHDQLPADFFRVIPAPTYLDNFASDRSHMVRTFSLISLVPMRTHNASLHSEGGPGHSHENQKDSTLSLVEELENIRYISPPPGYPAICGPRAKEKGVKTNLMEAFVRMSTRPGAESTIEEVETYGQVFDLEGFRSWSQEVRGGSQVHAAR